MLKRIIRDNYLNKIISKKENGLIKIITGIRRCGKSFLLDPMYKEYLLGLGIKENHIIKIDLDVRKQIEIDFVCNQFNKRYYIQSALSLPTREKTIQEERPLLKVNDNFKKIIITKDTKKHWVNEEGITVIGIIEFLLNKNSLDL